jgi:hypothetical protein
MDERQRLNLWRAIDAYANHRTPASWADVERVVADIEAQSSLVPNANGDVLPHIAFKVVPVADLPESTVPLWMPADAARPRVGLTASERFMRQVDAKILAEIEQTVADLPKPEDLP